MRIYYQPYNPNDQDCLPPERRASGLSLWKSHHSFCDGVSGICVILSAAKEYDQSYFLPAYTKDTPFWLALLVRIAAPFQIPFILWKTAL